VSEQLLFVLKLCLLALLYLFFFRVLRAVWAELKAPAAAGPTPAASPGVAAAASAPAPAPAKARRKEEKKAKKERQLQLVIVEPVDQKGQAYTVGNEMTLGRAAGCQVTVDDTYVSQLHARVFLRDGRYLVEDLGSTNGTYLNRQKVSAPTPIDPGDRLQVGNVVMEMR
jgi:pSer/pThr/pTyr-binding forkhead associated (FHA) protein